mmetsp:Transcript_15994/g.62485  ORF Transcript_15994/g.62485 Transcript_15994/m.62485 type:complete len:229 (+) Transcript_15994:107-793(+)
MAGKRTRRSSVAKGGDDAPVARKRRRSKAEEEEEDGGEPEQVAAMDVERAGDGESGEEDSDDEAPGEVSMSSAKKQALDARSLEIQNEIRLNTERRNANRKREEAKVARKQEALSANMLKRLAEKEKQREAERVAAEEAAAEQAEEAEEERKRAAAKAAKRKVKDLRLVKEVAPKLKVQLLTDDYGVSTTNAAAQAFLQQRLFGANAAKRAPPRSGKHASAYFISGKN